MRMMPEQVRFSITAAIDALQKATLDCKEAMIQAPGADRFGLGLLAELNHLTAGQNQRVLDQADEAIGCDATYPELTPNLSEHLVEKRQRRLEALAHQEAARRPRLH